MDEFWKSTVSDSKGSFCLGICSSLCFTCTYSRSLAQYKTHLTLEAIRIQATFDIIFQFICVDYETFQAFIFNESAF